MSKYRLRLKNGRVIGPLTVLQFQELLQKDLITGKEQCQLFPTGDWVDITTFEDLKEIIEAHFNIVVENKTQATFIKKLSEFELNEMVEKKDIQDDEVTEYPREFVPDLEETEQIAMDDVEETDIVVETKPAKSSPQNILDESGDKTIITPDTVNYLEELKKQQEFEKQEEQRKLVEQEEVEKNKIDLDKDSTQFISLSALKKDAAKEAKEKEVELENEAKRRKSEKLALEKKIEQERIEEKKREEEEELEQEEKQKKKKKIIYALVGLVLAYFFLFAEEEKKTLRPIKVVLPTVSFPQQYEVMDEKKAKDLHAKGLKLFQTKTYINKLKAAKYLRESVEYKFRNNTAMADLIFVYADLLEHLDDAIPSATKVFKLVQIVMRKSFRDVNYAEAAAYFYSSVGKQSAAIKVVEKFLALKTNKPTPTLFAIYLGALVKNGDLLKSKQVVDKLLKVKKRLFIVDEKIIDYYLYLKNYEEALKVLLPLLESNPKSVSLLLTKADLYIYSEDFKGLDKTLKQIRVLEAGRSPLYYSHYLYLLGMLNVKNNKVKKAVQLFKKSLKLYESPILRTKLASLASSEDEEANSLIAESKAISYIEESKIHIRKYQWKFAFQAALKALEEAPEYLPAQLYMASIQVQNGMFAEAISNLEALYQKYPHNPKIVFGLVDTYIESYRFADVKKLLLNLSASEFKDHPDYFAKTAKYYIFKEDFLNSVIWLHKAINANPLNEQITFDLAKQFIKYRKYNKAKLLINKAMDLAPDSVDFRVSYAEILYETEGTSSAIGYLFDMLQDFPDNTKILGAIGIYYYRSGQVKRFNSIKEKLTKLPNKDVSLYNFLIEAAKLDERYDDVISYAQEILKIKPGDLQTRLFLGQLYMTLERYKEALEQFNSIKDRLETYPKLKYYMSKLYLLTNNIEEATRLAKAEVKFNPGSVDGYLLLGDIYKTERKIVEAERQYRKAQKIDGNNVDALVGLAFVNFKTNKNEIALDLFNRAKSLDPNRAEIYKLLGDLYRIIGQSSLAIDSYKTFLELEPNSKYKGDIQNYINIMR